MRQLFDKISRAISACTTTTQHDSILLNGHEVPVDIGKFESIQPTYSDKTITFIDGGQAELLKAPNFSLQFIRVYACTFKEKTKIKQHKKEFYVLTTAQGGSDITYKAEIFSDEEKLLDEQDLLFPSMDPTIRNGTERADISRIGSVARRFAELAFASTLDSDFVIIDGTLEPTLTKEQNYLSKLPSNVAALAKTASLFTVKGNTAASLLNELGPTSAWHYPIMEQDRRSISFVKLHPKSDYVFRFETFGSKDVLPVVAAHSRDSVFRGYPYGLIWADKNARVSKQEASMLKTQFLLKLGRNIDRIKKYLSAANAHDVLDSIG